MHLVGRLFAILTLTIAITVQQGCATFQGGDPLQVTVAGIEPLESQGMEMRLLVKLRVQNPNDAAVDYNGIALEMKFKGNTLGTGVSDTTGSVPRFGEAIISVPVTISAFRMLSQAMGMMQGSGGGPITYEMKGKLNTTAFSAIHFQTRGEFNFPAMPAAGTEN